MVLGQQAAHSRQLRPPNALRHQLQLLQAVPLPVDAPRQRAVVLLPGGAQQARGLAGRHSGQARLDRALQLVGRPGRCGGCTVTQLGEKPTGDMSASVR